MEDQINMMNSPKTEEGSSGAIIGSIIIIVVIALGGFYLLKQSSRMDEGAGQTAEEIRASEDEATMNLQAQGSSDDVSAIEADLSGTELNGLDAESSNIDAELKLQ